MKIRSVRIRNFRSLVDLSLEFGDSTVVVGENNTGKSAVLDAVRLALSRSGSGRRRNVTEYDFHLATPDADPKRSPPIEINVTFREDQPDEWGQELVQALTEVVQTDLESDVDSICLQFSAQYDETTRQYESGWQFLNLAGEPLRVGPGMAYTFMQRVPLFYLSALRDVGQEFSSRSQFWGRLLRAMEIPEERQQQISEAIEQLNGELLRADNRLGDVTTTLQRIRAVISSGGNRDVGIRALPLRMWDLMSKSEVVMQGHGTGAHFPLNRHGQGTQSLAVVFLFQAFVQHFLGDTFGEGSVPILALEEPEAHLHPQAARALWQQVNGLTGQKLATTHSPYFLEHVPFRDLRVLRRSGAATQAYSLPERFSRGVPDNPALRAFVGANAPKFSYAAGSQMLTVRGCMTEPEYRSLLQAYPTPEERPTHAILRDLRDASAFFISDEELAQLQTFARRMRGEIVFARAWLLCEGPSDHYLVHRFAELLGTPLDASGVTVIDYQNNGSPGVFVALARALGVPWVMFCDSDQGGNDHVAQVGRRAPPAEVAARVRQLPAQDLEEFLVSQGHGAPLATAVTGLGKQLPAAADPGFGATLVQELRRLKGEYPSRFFEELQRANATADDVPQFLRDIIELVVREASA